MSVIMISAITDSEPNSDTKKTRMLVWHGGECPVSPKSIVTVQFRNGDISAFEKAAIWDWIHCGSDFDIVGYQLHT